MELYWLEQAEPDVPAENDWLSARELIFLNRLRFPKRHAEWRLGRWTAKRALAGFLNLPALPQVLATIELRPSESGAPEVFLEDKSAAIPISLSHRAGNAACAVAESQGVVGCDLEIIEPRSEAFVADYFTMAEQALVAKASGLDRFQLLALLWSAKESALKALRTGLRLDTRRVIVNLDSRVEAAGDGNGLCGNRLACREESPSKLYGWHPLQVRHVDGQTFSGWWSQAGHLVRTVVAAPSPDPPGVVQIASLRQEPSRHSVVFVRSEGSSVS